ncbi:MAG: glycosyltransferase family 39 protein [Bacteroidota bacterium]
MLQPIQQYFHQHPLRSILLLGLFVRVIAALCSHGYGFSDDHFLVIEVAQQWVDGVDYKSWMPWNGNTVASGHSLFYPGMHFVLFSFFETIGLNDPEVKMYIVRLLHALYSLVIVLLGYKISAHLSGPVVAKRVGLILALYWFIPMMSIRNMVEMVCIPPLMMATWLLIKADERNKLLSFFIAGVVAGIAFSFRFQTVMFIGGMGLAIWVQRKWIQGLFFGMGAALSMAAIQGGIDMYIWGRPFAEFAEYTNYNIANATNYINGPWYNYLILVSGLMIPPVSLFLFVGMYKSWRQYLWVIVPALCFFAFHSYFPNKQERFILPVIPFFVIAGVAGWTAFTTQSNYWLKHPAFLKGTWRFFWIVNTLLLIALTPSSTKISRVDAMSYLYHKNDMKTYMVESSNTWNAVMMPLFYVGKWDKPYEIAGEFPAQMVFDSISRNHLPMPDYIIFSEAENIEQRVETIKKYVHGLTYEATIESSLLDKTMHVLNPVNVNQTYFIYKVSK